MTREYGKILATLIFPALTRLLPLLGDVIH